LANPLIRVFQGRVLPAPFPFNRKAQGKGLPLEGWGLRELGKPKLFFPKKGVNFKRPWKGRFGKAKGRPFI